MKRRRCKKMTTVKSHQARGAEKRERGIGKPGFGLMEKERRGVNQGEVQSVFGPRRRGASTGSKTTLSDREGEGARGKNEKRATGTPLERGWKTTTGHHAEKNAKLGPQKGGPIGTTQEARLQKKRVRRGGNQPKERPWTGRVLHPKT